MRLILQVEAEVRDETVEHIREAMGSGAHVIVSIPINNMRDEINIDGPLVGAKEPAGA